MPTVVYKAGWVLNVTGFSIVLWSRLHLVINSPRIRRYILIMILANGVLCHTPIIVFEIGLKSSRFELFQKPMAIMACIQQTVFGLQDCIISALYIYYTKEFLNSGYSVNTRRVIILLVLVQVFVMALDACMVAFQYMNMFALKCTVQ